MHIFIIKTDAGKGKGENFLRSFHKTGCHMACFEKILAEFRGFFRIKPRAGENIDVYTFLVFGKMGSNGTGFDKLNQ